MKKYLLLLIAAVTLAVTSAQANLVTINWVENHSSTAGEFVLTSPNGAFTAFNTFCVEINQYISVGNTYSYTIANGSDGGINSPNLTPVALGTAWLYSQFFNGTLAGFTDTAQQQTDLQNAIWFFQGELSSLNNNPYVSLADQNVGNAFANGNGAYGVDVWNLYDPCSGVQCQSQLGIHPVPEVATWWVGLAILLPFGLATTKMFRRNQLA